jgi:hypothetical protein
MNNHHEERFATEEEIVAMERDLEEIKCETCGNDRTCPECLIKRGEEPFASMAMIRRRNNFKARRLV